MGLNPVQVSDLQNQMQTRQAFYDDVGTTRDYDNGDTPSLLSDDQKIQMVGADSGGNPNRDPEVRLNVCAPANQVESNRLKVQDVAVTFEGSEEKSQALSKLVWSWWNQNRLDEGQKSAHYSAIRDGDSYATCYYEDFPRVAFQQVYDGVDSGADVYYTDGDPTRPESAIKIWIEAKTATHMIRRKNVYYADRVEKWISRGDMTETFKDADWSPLRYGDKDWSPALQEVDSLSQPGEVATVEWWTETGTAPMYNDIGEVVGGSPGMGIPVKHYRHDAQGTAYGTSNIALIVPEGQDAVNHAANDLQAGAILAGYPVYYIIGAERDQTTWTTGPAELMVVEQSTGSAGAFPAANLEQLIRVKDTFMKDCATLTRTPLTYFNLSGVIPAEGTQLSLERALIAKVEDTQTAFGNTWEDVIRMWLKMEFVWGTALQGLIASHEEIDALDINTVWVDPNPSNAREQYEIAEKMKALGIPDRFIYRFLDFSEDEIDQMLSEKQVKQTMIIGTLAQRQQQLEQQNAQDQAAALDQARREGRTNGAQEETPA